MVAGRKPAAAEQCIVIAKAETEHAVDPNALRRYGALAKTVAVLVPKAIVWANEGDAAEVRKAKDYAAREGYRVFLYPVGERDPLGRAKREVLAPPVRRRRG